MANRVFSVRLFLQTPIKFTNNGCGGRGYSKKPASRQQEERRTLLCQARRRIFSNVMVHFY